MLNAGPIVNAERRTTWQGIATCAAGGRMGKFEPYDCSEQDNENLAVGALVLAAVQCLILNGRVKRSGLPSRRQLALTHFGRFATVAKSATCQRTSAPLAASSP